DAGRLAAVMRANDLDDAYVIDRAMRVVAGARGAAGRRADLLRLDLVRINAAFLGSPSIGPGYDLGGLTILAGYFPIIAPIPRDGAVKGRVTGVLVLEAGQSFLA